MAADKSLVQRWRSPEGEAVADEVVARLIAGRPLGGLGLAEHDGRVDLRGLALPPPSRLERFEFEGLFVEKLGDTVELRGRQLAGLDLSGASLTSMRFHDCVIADCAFVGATCRDWRLWGTRVVDCDFTQANLRDASVGTGRRDQSFNQWERVSFRGADFRVSANFAADYVDCDFTMAKLVDVKFQQCRLERCVFSGPLMRVQFDGRELSKDRPAPPQPSLIDVDFSAAIINDSQFFGCDLSRVRLPDDPDLLLVRRYPVVVERILADIATDPSEPARVLRAMLEMQRKGFRARDVDEVVNLRDYGREENDPLATLAEEAFRRAANAVTHDTAGDTSRDESSAGEGARRQGFAARWRSRRPQRGR